MATSQLVGVEGPSNAIIGELLCSAAEDSQRSQQQRRALRRAGRAAFRWPIEATQLLASGQSLRGLRFVGPWIERLMLGWIADPPAPREPPPIRRSFSSRTDVDRILRSDASLRKIRGDLQTHTIGSDGTASIQEMANAAIERGLEYLAITDHSKGLAIANGMNELEIARQGEEIERINAEIGGTRLRVLRAVEMNLSPRGEGDLDPDFVGQLELVLGAFHSRLRVAEDQTDRYLAALRYAPIHVLAHPRGRIFNFRIGLRADWERVFEAARRYDRAVEIDAYPDRQDLDVDLLRLARGAGVLVSIGSDAHAPSQLEFLDYGIAAAHAAGIPPERILNCWSVDELLSWARRPRQ
jgi:histidinol phosphatase-like PHP family hydrolase